MGSITVFGIGDFVKVFKAECPKGSDKARYSVNLLLDPKDPTDVKEIKKIKAQVDAAIKELGCKPGVSNLCFVKYDEAVMPDASYYNEKFKGFYMLKTNKGEEQGRPKVVDMRGDDITPADDKMYSGRRIAVNVDIHTYTKGSGGIRAGLNGVMDTGEDGPFGRLGGGAPSVNSMFGDYIDGSAAGPEDEDLPNFDEDEDLDFPDFEDEGPVYRMTDKAKGYTREQLIGMGKGWTDERLVAKGLMVIE